MQLSVCVCHLEWVHKKYEFAQRVPMERTIPISIDATHHTSLQDEKQKLTDIIFLPLPVFPDARVVSCKDSN